MMEEFIMRIGANSAALRTELGRVGAYAKAWATTLAEDFKTRLGRMFAAGFIFDKVAEAGARIFENIQAKILAVHRAQEELPGASTNFLQGLFNYTERVGLSFEQLSKPLLKFKQTLDAARADPQGKAMESLQRYGIVTSETDLKTQKFATSVAKLSDAYLKYGKNLQMVNEIAMAGKNNPAMLALLGLGGDRIAGMDKFNFFSDISPQAINLSAGLFGARKGMGQILTATAANFYTKFVTAELVQFATMLHPALGKGLQKGIEKIESKGAAADALAEQNAQIAASLQMETQKVDANTKHVELLERQRELGGEIAGQNKTTVAQMADEARKLTGIPRPRLYGVTPRMMAALNIQTLEERSKIAFEQGNDAASTALWQQAQSLRAQNTWLGEKDRNPMQKAASELEIVNAQLKPVKEMAEFVNQSHTHGSGGTW
jgi:hypothetical protein